MKSLSHKELIDLGRKWLNRPHRNGCNYSKIRFGYSKCSLILCDLVTAAGETPDVIGWAGSHSILLEAKTSLSDFYADLKKPWRIAGGMGDHRLYICEKGVIPLDKLPEKWGLLEVEKGKITIAKEPEYCEGNKHREIIMLLSKIRRTTEAQNYA